MMVAAVLAVASPARADSRWFSPEWFAGPWTVTLGAEGRVLPTYEGSSNYRFLPVPLFDIRRAGTPRHFQSPRDGASIGIVEFDNFRLGPTLKVRLPRREGDDAKLRGLGDVNFAVELGGFAEYWFTPWLRARGELRQGVSGHHGLTGDLAADVVMPVTPQLTLSGGPRLSFDSGKTMQTYFGVDPAQSVLSGLPVYNPSGGVRSYGAGVMARYEITPQWATHLFVEYERLIGPAADSPLVALRGSRDQVTTGLGVTYSFDVGPFFR
ncbi:MAG: MipA/OmpV family protein [Pseudolabrys sp.]|nr:MipA/OmpV family protein [Pseudolabrys sp.]